MARVTVWVTSAGRAGVGGEHEDGDFGFDLAHAFGDLAAVHAGHGVVEDDGFDGLGGEEVEAGGAVECGEDAIAGSLEQHAAHVEADSFVIDAQDEMLGSWHGRALGGKWFRFLC